MTQTIYVDILLAVNLFVNYLLLMIAEKIARCPTRKRRLLMGAALGAAASLVILLPPMGMALSLLLKAAGCMAMVLAAFPIRSVRQFVRLAACLLVSSFLLAGVMLFVYSALPLGVYCGNGAFYLPVSPIVLVLTAAGAYLLLSVFTRLSRAYSSGQRLWRVRLENDGRQTEATAMVDTGNSLSEQFSDRPVLLMQLDALSPILPPEVCAAFEEGLVHNLPTAWRTRFRLIPYRTVGGEGLLPAFRCDRVFVGTGARTAQYGDVYVAACVQPLSQGEFQALLPPGLVPEQPDLVSRRESV